MNKEHDQPVDEDDDNHLFLNNESMKTNQSDKRGSILNKLEFLFYITLMVVFIPAYIFLNGTIFIDIIVIVALISMSIFCIKELIPPIKHFFSLLRK